jgi:hypothetical protein
MGLLLVDELHKALDRYDWALFPRVRRLDYFNLLLSEESTCLWDDDTWFTISATSPKTESIFTARESALIDSRPIRIGSQIKRCYFGTTDSVFRCIFEGFRMAYQLKRPSIK